MHISSIEHTKTSSCLGCTHLFLVNCLVNYLALQLCYLPQYSNNNNTRITTIGCHNSLHALGALTFLRSFVAGKTNFCSQLLASLVHFTVVKSQAILIIRLGVVGVISALTLYLLPASKRRNFYLVGYVQAL